MIKHRKKIFLFSTLLVIASITALFFWQLNLGIEFTGGSKMRVLYEKNPPSIDRVQKKLSSLNLEEYYVKPLGEKGYLIEMGAITEAKHIKVRKNLKGLGESMKEQGFTRMGPEIGQELRHKALRAIFFSLIAVVVYISWAFRKVSYPLSSWKYGVAAIVALFHDVLITVGVFSVLGHFLGVKIDVAFVAALLTIVGYSVNDTIVIFDRVRENLKKSVRENFADLVNLSISQSITRSINTSTTTLMVLLAIFLLGANTIFYFVLALMLGVGLGTYSSLFVASPLVVEWEKRSGK